jgi:hypothetical protein
MTMMTIKKISCIVAYCEGNKTLLTSVNGVREAQDGWYRFLIDDEGRQATQGPYISEAAARTDGEH